MENVVYDAVLDPYGCRSKMIINVGRIKNSKIHHLEDECSSVDSGLFFYHFYRFSGKMRENLIRKEIS